MRVLIIYRMQSREAVEPIATFLRVEGFEVDFETAALGGVRSVIDAIPDADRVLVLWDGEAIEGRSLHACAEYAGELGKLIVLLSGVSEAPFDPSVPRFLIREPAKLGVPPFYGDVTRLLRLELHQIPAKRMLAKRIPMPEDPRWTIFRSINPGRAANRAANRHPDDSEGVKQENAHLKADVWRLRIEGEKAAETIERLQKRIEGTDTRTWIGARLKPHGFSSPNDLRIAIKSPSIVRPAQSFLLQVWFFGMFQKQRADKLAEQADVSAKDRGTTSLEVEAARGAELTVTLELGGLESSETVERIIWQGVASSTQFTLVVPDIALKTRYFPTIRVFLDGMPFAKHTISVVSEPGIRIDRAVRESQPRHYRRAFLSYASQDRSKVLEQAQAMRAVGVEVFQDCLDLSPSDRWERKRYIQITQADVFLLFWSKDAAKSTWVRKEAEFALHCQRTRRKETPEIVPVILDGAPPSVPPLSLKHIHFNDPVRCIIAA